MRYHLFRASSPGFASYRGGAGRPGPGSLPRTARNTDRTRRRFHTAGRSRGKRRGRAERWYRGRSRAARNCAGIFRSGRAPHPDDGGARPFRLRMRALIPTAGLQQSKALSSSPSSLFPGRRYLPWNSAPATISWAGFLASSKFARQWRQAAEPPVWPGHLQRPIVRSGPLASVHRRPRPAVSDSGRNRIPDQAYSRLRPRTTVSSDCFVTGARTQALDARSQQYSWRPPTRAGCAFSATPGLNRPLRPMEMRRIKAAGSQKSMPKPGPNPTGDKARSCLDTRRTAVAALTRDR
jgi:hypothetical protein